MPRLALPDPIRVFVASPSDVLDERGALANLVADINRTILAVAPHVPQLELVRWETHVTPSAGRPQGVVNEQVGSFDILVGIMWQRFGTPSGEAGSGTEEEFDRAYRQWKKNGTPDILFYFCQAAAPPAKTREDIEQTKRVIDFRDRLSSLALVWEYERHDKFVETVHPHLLRALQRAIARRGREGETATVMPASPGIRSRFRELALEYESTRQRLERSDERTRKMELIATQMRTLAIPGVALVDEFMSSSDAGERLAATTILQVVPSEKALTWLADRFSEQHAFLGYHAGRALLTAARTLGCIHKGAIQTAIRVAVDRLGRDNSDTDRYRMLTLATDELSARCGQRGSEPR